MLSSLWAITPMLFSEMILPPPETSVMVSLFNVLTETEPESPRVPPPEPAIPILVISWSLIELALRFLTVRLLPESLVLVVPVILFTETPAPAETPPEPVTTTAILPVLPKRLEATSTVPVALSVELLFIVE